MLNIILHFFTGFKIFFILTLFTYLHQFILSGCTYKKTLKIPNEKPKFMTKTKIGLYFLYLTLSLILYYMISFYVLVVLTVGLGLFSLSVIQKTSVATLKPLDKYNSEPIVKKCWNYYLLVLNTITKLFTPIHEFFDSFINRVKADCVDMFISKYINQQVENIQLPPNINEEFEKMQELFKLQAGSFDFLNDLSNTKNNKEIELTNKVLLEDSSDDLSSFVNDNTNKVSPFNKKDD